MQKDTNLNVDSKPHEDVVHLLVFHIFTKLWFHKLHWISWSNSRP